ncbi:unnamed protein product [Bursaphelenchus xylophilus]|uniref:(pine wood nematode) hypothetical protein n=1 Tax=Bursaphelenchus xylophilus TaxID=6326 RepID=A0A1I7S1V4_BURXY|nr:unnamed protein product [Bursaphelenchus xylophilus]CAG9089995.1 unnamed protein product [Bursaphelenchus xylophilus]
MSKQGRKKPRIMQRKNLKLEADSSESHPIPDVDEELKKNLIVHAGIAHKAPESIILKLPIEREVELVPEESTEMECYPCPFCNKLYLTCSGLEKHGLDEHNGRMPEIMILIQRIQRIWAYFNQTPGSRARILDKKEISSIPRNDKKLEENEEDMCRKCGLMLDTTRPLAVRRHQKIHEANEKFREKMETKYGKMYTSQQTCELCDLTFTSKAILFYHEQLSHPENKPEAYKCDVCDTIYESKEVLDGHLSIVHTVTAPILRFGIILVSHGDMACTINQCTECGAIFEKLRSVHEHVRKIHGLTTPFDGQLHQNDRDIRLSCTLVDGSLQTTALCCSQRLTLAELSSHNRDRHKKSL